MTVAEAIQILMDVSAKAGENTEEAFVRRIEAEDTDEACTEVARESKVELEEVIEIRNLWKAIEVATEHLNKAVEGTPR